MIAKTTRTIIFKVVCLFLLSLSAVSCSSNSKSLPETTAVEKVHDHYTTRIYQLDSAVQQLSNAIAGKAPTAELQALFREAKYAYKRTEYLTELYFPYTAKSLNGPPLDEVEFDDPNQVIIPPEGFQVIEEMLFPTQDPENHQQLVEAVNQLASNVHRLKTVTATTTFTDSHIFESLKLEVYRIITLGISGFDSPAALNSIAEAEVAIKELSLVFEFYKGELSKRNAELATAATAEFTAASEYLARYNDFDSFDRLSFISQHANKISENLQESQVALEVGFLTEIGPLTPHAKTLFDKNAFNTAYFAPGYNKIPTPKQVALGELLFFDPVLSANNSRACVSCHNPEKAFTDGLAKSIAFEQKGEVLRNAPTILNSGLQSALFYDSRVVFLEDQITDVLNNPLEMHGNFEEAVKKLTDNSAYVSLFDQAYEDTVETPVTSKKIRMALAAFIRSKVAMNSRFDQYMRGDTSMLSAEEKHGFNLFMGKAACGTCHFMPLFNGSVPPAYKVAESEILGVPKSPDTTNIELDEDLGKYHLHKKDLHKLAFKTPSVRNVGLTAPYMHNGVYETLEQVMDFYNKGGGEGMGLHVPHQTLAPDALNLNTGEVNALIAFMNALTDTSGHTTIPKPLPYSNKAAVRADTKSVY